MLKRNLSFLKLCFLLFFTDQAKAVTLTSGQTDYATTADITVSGVGISSSLSGTSSSLNKIKNLHIITTGNSGSTSSAYGIRSSGNYNQITNNINAAIVTTGNSGRGISITNNSVVNNLGNITTGGTTSYGIYAGGNNNVVNSFGAISTLNTTSYGIYLNGNGNSAVNSGSINTKVYGVYGNGDANQISNFGIITTTTSSSAHGVYVSAGSASNASASNYSIVNNSGVINSSGNGIYVKDNYTSINNSGSITTAFGSTISAIRNEGDNVIITNSGNINSANYAIYNSGLNTIINNSGNLIGGVRIGSGTLNILGGNIGDEVDGSSNSGSVNIGSSLNLGIIFNQTKSFRDLDILNIKSGSILNSGNNISANKILLDVDSTLNLNDGSSLSALIQGSSNSVGSLNISNSQIIFENGIGISGNSLANLNINYGSSINSSGNIYAANILVGGNLNFLKEDNLTIFGNVAGTGSGLLNIGSQNQIIAGNFSLKDGDYLAVALKNNGVGNLTVSGITSIDANSKLAITTSLNQGYIASGTRYNVINAASGSTINSISDENISVNGGSSNISGLLKFTTIATSNGLILNIDRLPASQITSNQNAENIYRNLNNIGNSSSGKLLEFQEYLGGAGLNGEEITKTLNQLAPTSTKASLATIKNIVTNSAAIIENRLEKINFRNSDEILKNSFWMQGFGQSLAQKQVKDDDGYKANSAGMVIGLDKKVKDDIGIGSSFSFVQSSIKNLDSNKRNSINIYQTNIYGYRNFDKYFIDAVGGFSFNQFNSNRAISAVNSNAKARYYGQTYLVKIKSGFVKNLENDFYISPEISLNFLHNDIASYREKGADQLNLNVGHVAANFLEGQIGLNFGYNSAIYELPEFRKFAANLKISYGYAIINDAPVTVANFIDQKTNFDYTISHQDSSSLKLGTELFAYHKSNTILSVDYGFEHKATLSSHFILMKIKEEF